MAGRLFELFVSSKKQKEREKEYAAKVFPLGDTQKELDLQLLSRLVQPRDDASSALFCMITLRDKYHVEEDDTESPNAQEWLDQMRDYGVSLQGLKACYALTALTNGCPDLASYPSEETVRALAGSYMDSPKKRRF